MIAANRELIKDSFYIPKNLVYFNAGTFGVCPKPVLEEKIRFLREIEANPVIAFSETLFNSALENLKILAHRLKVDYKNLALLQNVTHGIGSVLHSIDVKSGDEILLTNYTYAAIRMSTEVSFAGRGGIIRTMSLEPPFESADHIINLYIEFVKKYPEIKYAIIDHIPSEMPMVQPIKQIAKALRDMGVFVIIDGAHCPGQLKGLDIGDIGADVYVGNLHKWYFTPRGLAFMAIHPNCKLKILHPIVSHLHNKSFYERFLYSGTQDFTNILCIKSVFQFIDSIGGIEEIYQYNTELIEKGITYLENSWNVNCKRFPEMAPFMRLIPFPEGFGKHHHRISKMIANVFEREYYRFTNDKLGFTATAFLIQGKLHFRLCSQIYLEFEDFIKFSKAVFLWLEMLDNHDNM